MKKNTLNQTTNITTDDFILLYLSCNILKGNYFIVKDELINFIEFCKTNKFFLNLLNNIDTKENLDNSINKLKEKGICRSYPKDEYNKYIILNNISSLQLIILIKDNIDFFEEMLDFIKEFEQHQIAKLLEKAKYENNNYYKKQLKASNK